MLPGAEVRLMAHLRSLTREAIMRERLSTRMAIGAMVEAAVTTSALHLVFSLAETRKTKHLALTLAITQAKTFELDPRPLDVTRISQSHDQEFTLGTLKHVMLLLRNSHAPMRLGACKASLAFKAGGAFVFRRLACSRCRFRILASASFRP